jgi:hypothetical protein
LGNGKDHGQGAHKCKKAKLAPSTNKTMR